MKSVLMVGAGSCQINGILRLKALGFKVIVADYHEESPGKKLCDCGVLADAFDPVAIERAARSHKVSGILTVGTDQPVLSVTLAQHTLGLPYFLSKETALSVTNKRVMKALFDKHKIPSVPYTLIGRTFNNDELSAIAPPYVIKPVDSQGQRGIYKCNSIEAIREKLPSTFMYTREDKVLVEAYYPNDEVTLSGWVDRGEVHVLTITDRVTFDPSIQIGVCMAHDAPSKHLNHYGEAFVELSKHICGAFKITEGPIYFQFLVGAQGIKVNEIACRLGGAYEDLFIPHLTGVDVLSLNIEGALCRDYDKSSLMKRTPLGLLGYLSTELFFCNPGVIQSLTELKTIRELPYVLDAGYNIKEGQVITGIENASQRAGFVIVTGKDEEDIKTNIDDLYLRLKVFDTDGNNLIIKRQRS